jgi:ADP-heptose:LPS heptosyltransferase
MAARVLLVRFSAIGDCVMAAWAASSIRRRDPQTTLVWAAESRCAPVIDRVHLATSVAEFPRDRWKRNRWSPRVWREQLLAFSTLRKSRFDVGFDLQGHSKTALCLRIANPARRFAARATDALASRLSPTVGDRPVGTHTVDWNHHVISQFEPYSLDERPIMPEFELPRSAAPLATISVSAGQPEKAYPAQHWREVAQSLLSEGFRVAFLGGPTDEPILLAGCEDHVGKLPLRETMQWVAQSAIHLASDTGTGHMAAAYGVPVVSVFGPMDPREFRPYTTRGIVLREGLDPASVSPSAVIDAARSLVADSLLN